MNAPNSNRHPLDKYIDEKLEQLNVEFDPSGWHSVQNMMKSQTEIANPNNSSTFSKLLSIKSIAIFTVSTLILSLLMYQLIIKEPTHINNSNQIINEPSVDQDIIDSSNQYNENDDKVKSGPNFIPTSQDKEILNKSYDKVPSAVDSIQILDANGSQITIDSSLILDQKDTTKTKKKHIVW